MDKVILVDARNTLFVDVALETKLQSLLDSYPNPKVVVTNAKPAKRTELGINLSPYPVFTLEHNPNKSSPEYFKRVCKEYDLRAKDFVYFEHNPEAVASAKSVGIATHRYDPEKRDIAAVKEFLDKNL